MKTGKVIREALRPQAGFLGKVAFRKPGTAYVNLLKAG